MFTSVSTSNCCDPKKIASLAKSTSSFCDPKIAAMTNPTATTESAIETIAPIRNFQQNERNMNNPYTTKSSNNNISSSRDCSNRDMSCTTAYDLATTTGLSTTACFHYIDFSDDDDDDDDSLVAAVSNDKNNNSNSNSNKKKRQYTKKVVVFGATGFVGYHLIERLAFEHPDWKIVAVTRYRVRPLCFQKQSLANVVMAQADAMHLDDVLRVCRGKKCEIIFSCLELPNCQKRYWAKKWPLIIDNLLEAIMVDSTTTNNNPVKSKKSKSTTATTTPTSPVAVNEESAVTVVETILKLLPDQTLFLRDQQQNHPPQPPPSQVQEEHNNQQQQYRQGQQGQRISQQQQSREQQQQRRRRRLVFCDNLWAYGAGTEISAQMEPLRPSFATKPGIRAEVHAMLQDHMKRYPQTVTVVGASDVFGPRPSGGCGCCGCSKTATTTTKTTATTTNSQTKSTLCARSSQSSSTLSTLFGVNAMIDKLINTQAPLAVAPTSAAADNSRRRGAGGSKHEIYHDFCFVKDLAAALATVAERDRAYDKFWIAPHSIHNQTVQTVGNHVALQINNNYDSTRRRNSCSTDASVTTRKSETNNNKRKEKHSSSNNNNNNNKIQMSFNHFSTSMSRELSHLDCSKSSTHFVTSSSSSSTSGSGSHDSKQNDSNKSRLNSSNKSSSNNNNNSTNNNNDRSSKKNNDKMNSSNNSNNVAVVPVPVRFRTVRTVWFYLTTGAGGWLWKQQRRGGGCNHSSSIIRNNRREMIEMLPFWAEDYTVDDTDFLEEFGVKPTPCDKALQETVAFYLQEKVFVS